MFKGEDVFFKFDMTGYEHFFLLGVKTIKRMMRNGIAKEHTWSRTRFEFVSTVGTKPRITKTAKNTERIVGRMSME